MHIIFLNFLQFLVELQFYVITATAVINFSTTALEPQPWFLKIPQPKQEPQPRFSENSQPIDHYSERPGMPLWNFLEVISEPQKMAQYNLPSENFHKNS